MRTNVQIDLTDEQRNRLAAFLDRRVSKRLATRSDVRAYLAGCIAAALDAPPPWSPSRDIDKNRDGAVDDLLTDDLVYPEWIVSDHQRDNYRRGWLQVARSAYITYGAR